MAKLKMAPEMLDSLCAALDAKLAEHPNAAAEYEAAGLSPMRFRWDLLHASKWDTRQAYAAGLNDAHIDSAIRQALEDSHVS